MTEVSEKECKTLVAVDEGEEISYALLWCLTNIVNQNSKDTLTLLHARPPRAVYSALDGSGYLFSSDILATVEKYSNETAECVIEKAKRIGKDFNDVETKVDHGDPRDVICQVAERLNVDLVIMGSHGYGLIKSVSNHCAQNLKCPVLIVKKQKSNDAN